jgi:taurine dioxygenase
MKIGFVAARRLKSPLGGVRALSNPEYTMRFEGRTRRESLPLLRYLFEHGSKPEFVTRFSWQPGSIAFWDNRQVWHLAVNDYHGMRRVMNRILLTGTKPVPAV